MSQVFKEANIFIDFHTEKFGNEVDRVDVRWEKRPHPSGEVIRPVHYVYLKGNTAPIECVVDYETLAKWMYAKFAPPIPVSYEERLREETNTEVDRKNIIPHPTTSMVQGKETPKDIAFGIALAFDNFICDHRIDRKEIIHYLNAINRARK